MTGKCCICGAEEELPAGMSPPVVCDRPECIEQVRGLGWRLLLDQFIETKVADDGEMLFRLKRGGVE